MSEIWEGMDGGVMWYGKKKKAEVEVKQDVQFQNGNEAHQQKWSRRQCGQWGKQEQLEVML